MEKQCSTDNNASEVKDKGQSHVAPSPSTVSQNVLMKEDQKPKELAMPATDEFCGTSVQKEVVKSIEPNSINKIESGFKTQTEINITSSSESVESHANGRRETDSSLETVIKVFSLIFILLRYQIGSTLC